MAGAVKGFGFSVEYALYDISYANLILMGATLPTYDSKAKDGNHGDGDIINAEDPRNREKVRQIFNMD